MKWENETKVEDKQKYNWTSEKENYTISIWETVRGKILHDYCLRLDEIKHSKHNIKGKKSTL